MKSEYRTVKERAVTEFVERKSRFISTVIPITTEEEALELINECRSKYHDATHNVYAYVLDSNNIMRYSDDGEPQGTAGMPVLDVIRKENLTDVAVVVTRYFGGILLGGGGLVRAYSHSAKLGIDEAKIITRTLCFEYELKMPYTLLGKMQYTVETGGYIIKGIEYNEDVVIRVYVKSGEEGKFTSLITQSSNAQVEAVKVDETYLSL